MTSPLRWRPRTGLLVTVALLAVAAGVLALRDGSDDLPARAGSRSATIRMSDGISLAAEVTMPDAQHRPPLLVMPASWGSGASEYQLRAERFAKAGYAVVAYAQRGNRGSAGRIDFAGTPTQRDVTAVITWALAHTRADPHRIGLLGVSYGGGISLLAAAQDARVKAVVAMSTWTNLYGALAQNRTLEVGAVHQLLGPRGDAPRLNPELARLGRDVSTDAPAALTALDRLSTSRSPTSYLTELNRRHVAVMLANGWEDSIFPPAPLVDFFERLAGPKRLEFGTGDHTGPESSGLAGADSNRVTQDAGAWLDHYVAGTGRTALGPSVRLQDVATGAWRGYAGWPGARAASTVTLTDPRRPGGGGATTASATQPWQASLRAGADSLATSGPSQFVPAGSYRPPALATGALMPGSALRWTGGPVTSPLSVVGTPHLQISMSSSNGVATFFAYLYDVSQAGVGQLMTVTPFTVAGLSPTTSHRAELALNPISWTIAAGHHAELILDVADPRYLSNRQPDSVLTFASTIAAPVTLTVPLAS